MTIKYVSRVFREYEIVDRSPLVTHLVIEVEINDRQALVTHLVIEVEVSNETPAGDFIFADAVIARGAVSSASITADAAIVPITTTANLFPADAVIVATFVQSWHFTADAVIESRKAVNMDAYIVPLAVCPTVYYPSFSGPYEVVLLDHDLTTEVVRVDEYTRLEYTRTITGEGYHGYGFYSIEGDPDKMQSDEWTLDRILSVRHAETSGLVVEFEGFHRDRGHWHDQKGQRRFRSSGPNLNHLMTRRTTQAWPSNRAFFSINQPFTNIMRLLAITNAQAAAGWLRWMQSFSVTPTTDEGQTLNMHYRNSKLFEDLDALADLGADWEILRDEVTSPPKLRFHVHYPYKGRDRRRNNQCGEPTVAFSIDNDNILLPKYEQFRTNEVTVVYVAGEGIGIDREIQERHNVAGRVSDSPWNRIERFMEQSQETSSGALAAWGDAYLVEHGISRSFGLRLPESGQYAYGDEWNLGDYCTAIYEGQTYDVRIVAVKVTLEAPKGRTVVPIFQILPRLVDY